jgi:superfamily II DNA or RNA helicase/HKD family nuclease
VNELHIGVYECLLDEELQQMLEANPELRPILRSIDDETAPHTYSQFIGQIFYQALRTAKKDQRISILNRVIELLSATDGLDYLSRKKLLSKDKNQLVEIGSAHTGFTRPETPLSTSSLLTGQGADPPLEHELRAEMESSDRVDILVSFIKWSGLRLLMPAFEKLEQRNVPVRIISTSYMGASDPVALEWLANQSNVSVRVSFDTGGTRLHAKAYHFARKTGFSTAYIGSANMSHTAMTQGLEWTVKTTAQDMPHILARFMAEFDTYWESIDFESLGPDNFARFRREITKYRTRSDNRPQFFAEITPRPFQLRILEALDAARQSGNKRNLVVAATGTGKTVIAALDYKRTVETQSKKIPLLFVVHRKEILEQALACFRTILRDQNFGELLVEGNRPTEWDHVFASVQSLNSQQPWNTLGESHFDFVIVDEAHHGAASSYRPIFDHLKPEFLLGLTATPERMDGSLISPDFGGRYAAEIRLPEALEEKLLCPFHYFGVADNIDLDDDRFWRNGRYDSKELETVFTGDDFRAKQRVDTILQALDRYQPELEDIHGVGFCAGVKHAHFMAHHFNARGISAAVLLGETSSEERTERLKKFREGELSFLFTVDVLSEGWDVPEINLVMFLRPTESLTVFLQQLGRGLRHSPGKECLTVLDFVGQLHRKYRIDTKFTALLTHRRQRIDREIENDFPHLAPGCNIHLERVAREHILRRIKSVLDNLNNFIPETIRTWETDISKPLTFGNFVQETSLSANVILSKRSWSEWKSMASNQPKPDDPDFTLGRKALSRIALRTDPDILQAVEEIYEVAENKTQYDEKMATALHYLFWGKKGGAVGVDSIAGSLEKWRSNPSLARDGAEIAAWRRSTQPVPITEIELPFPCNLKLHASYGSAEIKSALGLATLKSPGSTGVGVLHSSELKCYVHLVTFRKSDQDFSPTTRYRDYPVSQTRLHWESQSNTSQVSPVGQNYIHFEDRGYTILFFARLEKRIDGETAPFTFLGPAKSLISYDGNRPISMVWELEYSMSAAMYEEARSV